MRIGVLLAATLAAVLATAASASNLDRGLYRPPAKLSEASKTIWMGEWAACRHDSLRVLAREIGVKVAPGRSPQVTAVLIAQKAEAPLWVVDSQLQTAVDGCRNGILWRYYHETPRHQKAR